MKAIILSAGQGKRLLPLTEQTPKSLLPLHNGQSILGWQLSQLAKAGVEEAIVVSGFHAPKIRTEIAAYRSIINVREVYNPFFKLADNLGSVWRGLMDIPHGEDFIVLNGDTLFTHEVAQTLLQDQKSAVTLTIARKESYDDDDMKVVTEQGELRRVGKKLPMDSVNGESIGMMKFCGAGAQWFRECVNAAMETEEGLKTWYLAVLDKMAQSPKNISDNIYVGVVEVPQSQWCEVDFPVDYKQACQATQSWDESIAAGAVPLKASETA